MWRRAAPGRGSSSTLGRQTSAIDVSRRATLGDDGAARVPLRLGRSVAPLPPPRRLPVSLPFGDAPVVAVQDRALRSRLLARPRVPASAVLRRRPVGRSPGIPARRVARHQPARSGTRRRDPRLRRRRWLQRISVRRPIGRRKDDHRATVAGRARRRGPQRRPRRLARAMRTESGCTARRGTARNRWPRQGASRLAGMFFLQAPRSS